MSMMDIIERDNTGNIWVTDVARSKINKFNVDTNQVEENLIPVEHIKNRSMGENYLGELDVMVNIPGVTDMAFDESGNAYLPIINYNKLYKISVN